MLKDVRGKLLAKRYQSLHEFVLDVDTVFTDARKRLGRDDSVYADSIALQKLFAEALQAVLAERNITSPGCSDYDIEHVTALVAKEEALPAVAAPASTAPTDELLSDAGGYSVGEFAYVSTSGSATTSICLITKLFLREDGVEMFEGVRYLRPIETFHLTTRTFYENEVFKTKEVVSEPVTELAAKCWVLFMKDYCAYTVAEIAETDLYCCESRYIKNGKKIEKIRNFTSEGLAPELIAREPKLNLRELVKIKSPLADTDDDDDDAEAANDDAAAAMGDYPVPKLDDPRNVVQPLELLKGCTYYKTLCLDSEPFSIGDAILLRNPDERKKAFPFVALIKRMWVDDKGFPYCSGPWLARPIETHHDPSKSFYTNELLLTASSDSNSMLSIIRKCAIMQVSDYQSWRPLAIADPYVFICESRYNDKKKEIAIMKS
jgi:protein polybromo-1